MGTLVVVGFLGFVLLGLSRWAHIVRAQHEHDAAPPTSAMVPRGGALGAAVTPRQFGRRTGWFAVRAADAEVVARCLGLRTAVPTDRAAGLAAAGAGLFVGREGPWVVAVGGDALRADGERLSAALRRLSAEFGEAFWFACDDRGDRFGWALARAGVLQRAVCCDGDADMFAWDEGALTVAEDELGFFVADPRDLSGDAIRWWPTQDDLFALAARWTFDPRRVDPAATAPGLLGRW